MISFSPSHCRCCCSAHADVNRGEKEEMVDENFLRQQPRGSSSSKRREREREEKENKCSRECSVCVVQEEGLCCVGNTGTAHNDVERM